MTLLRLRTQLVIAAVMIICVLVGTLLFIIRRSVRAEIDRQVREGTAASLRAFEIVQREQETDLSRTAEMLAELPTLKALMPSQDPATIQDASTPFWQLAGSDLLLLAGPDGRILGFHVKQPGWSPRLIDADLRTSLAHGAGAAWWYANGQLYWVVIRPIAAGGARHATPLGLMAVGYRVDSSVAERLAVVSGSMVALAMGHRIIASTLSPAGEHQLGALIASTRSGADPAAEPIALGSDRYQLASVSLRDGTQAPVLCYVLMPLLPANRFLQTLNRTIFLLGLSAILFAALLLSFVSRTITRPLENLAAGVRALASGDYDFSIATHRSAEVAELSNAFSRMRADLLDSQRRWLEAERIAALGRAAGSISHDLRHHLATVVANAEFLYESDDSKPDRDEIYAEIQTASQQMTDLLQSLRELSREDAAISPVPASLDHSIRRVIDSVLARPEYRNAAVSLAVSGDMEGVFDAKKLERVFFNLLLNACEASAHGPCRIGIDIRSSADQFEVRVSDNGSGIPEDVRDSLFNPFVSSGKPNGTGMGLAIVRKIVQDHGGLIGVETTSPAGTTFLLLLPRRMRRTGPENKRTAASEQPAEAGPSGAMPTRRDA